MSTARGSIHDMIQCPYQPSHWVGASRLQTHLIRCRQQNPDVAKDMSICPYNQVHHVLTKDMSLHLTVCSDAEFQQLHGLGSTVGMLTQSYFELNLGPDPNMSFSSSQLRLQRESREQQMLEGRGGFNDTINLDESYDFTGSQQLDESELNLTIRTYETDDESQLSEAETEIVLRSPNSSIVSQDGDGRSLDSSLSLNYADFSGSLTRSVTEAVAEGLPRCSSTVRIGVGVGQDQDMLFQEEESWNMPERYEGPN